MFLLSLCLPACTLQYVDPGLRQPRYPRAEAVQARAYQQIDSIEWAVRRGDLDEDIADALADNDDTVLELTDHFQHSFSPPRDLTRREDALLNGMLDDNAFLLEDAIRRRSAWRWSFNRGFASYPSDPADQRIYCVHLHYRLKRQYYEVEAKERSGKLSPETAAEMRRRIVRIREDRLQAIRRAERLSLGREDSLKMDGWVRENAKALKEAERGGRGRFERSMTLPGSPAGTRKVYREDRWRNEELRPGRGKKLGLKGMEDEDVPAPTPIPALRPTPTALPDLREADEHEKAGPKREPRGGKSGRGGKDRVDREGDRERTKGKDLKGGRPKGRGRDLQKEEDQEATPTPEGTRVPEEEGPGKGQGRRDRKWDGEGK
jgi:hypothetical protein